MQTLCTSIKAAKGLASLDRLARPFAKCDTGTKSLHAGSPCFFVFALNVRYVEAGRKYNILCTISLAIVLYGVNSSKSDLKFHLLS